MDQRDSQICPACFTNVHFTETETQRGSGSLEIIPVVSDRFRTHVCSLSFFDPFHNIILWEPPFPPIFLLEWKRKLDIVVYIPLLKSKFGLMI